nr:adenosylcobinamide-phosphate synthase CbiB [uncultured Peptostreptococcus sp.]
MLETYSIFWSSNIILILILAYLLDLLVGDPYWFPHPVIFMGRLISILERKFRYIVDRLLCISRDGKNPVNSAYRSVGLKISGLFIWLVLVGISYILAYVWSGLVILNTYLGMVVSVVAMCTCLSTKCLAYEAKKVYMCLEKGDIFMARIHLSYIVGRDTRNLEEAEIIRATVETIAENTVDGTLAPMFYYMLGGLPLAFAYKAVNTMDSMLGYKNEQYKDLGLFPARLDDVFNYIPARLSLIFFTIASLLLGYDYRGAIRIGLRDRKNHTSPNCAYPEGAVAGALGIRLGGTNSYFGQEVYKPSIGDAKKGLDKEDILRANRLLYMSSLVGLLFLSTIYIFVVA